MAILETYAFMQGLTLQRSIELFTLTAVIVPLLYAIINEFIRASARISGLKGPQGLPIIGNLAQIRKNAAEQYRVWSKKYGPVYQIQLGNIPVVVVNSAAAAKFLWGQNSLALSSRPEFYTFHKIVSSTSGTTVATSPYNESLKRRRKGAASALNRPSVETYIPHLDIETRTFVAELFNLGSKGKVSVDPTPMIQRLSLSMSLTLNWGVRVESQNELFHEITKVEEEISKFRSTTGNLQDYIPALRLNPFNNNSKNAKEMRDRRDKYLRFLNQGLDQRIQDGTHSPCIQANVLLNKETKLNTEELTSISLSMLSGGLDTLTTLVTWSFACLSQRPDIQDKAAAAIAEFYSLDEPLCDATDDHRCTYVACLVKECLRMFTVLRLCLPRASIKDVTYNGVVIPKGTVYFLNAWACNMDPEVWSDPEEFRPERWMEQPDAPMFTYGMGYRMCGGSLLANREMYLLLMRTLNSFRLESDDPVEWDPIRGNSDPTSLVAIPKHYKIKFIPKKIQVLQQALC